jgi:hypothetical protein
MGAWDKYDVFSRALISGILFALLIDLAPLHAAGVIVIGDSWAEPIGVKLGDVMVQRGHPEVPVVTTPYWGGPRNLDTPEGFAAIAGWLEESPEASHLYMMMGQNNWLCCWTTGMIGSQEEADLFASIIDHTQNVVDYILSIRPEMKIVWTAGEYFRPHHLGTPTEVNASHDRRAELAVAFSADRPELTFLDWNGLFQVTFGFNGVKYTEFDPDYFIPPGDPSLPDPTLPSPQAAFNNPAHPNSRGYGVLASAVYDQYFSHELDDASFQINAGLSDAWYNPATDGQGFLISVFPERRELFLAWFTYDVERPVGSVAQLGEPGHRWLTAQGPYEGDSAVLTIYVSEGGVFDSAEAAVNTRPDGTLTLEFADCSEALLNYEITSLGISDQIPLERIVPDNQALCETLSAPVRHRQ